MLRRAFVAALLFAAGPLGAAESWSCLFADAGLVVGDVAIVYKIDGDETADPGATLTEGTTANGWTSYQVGGFPSAESVGGTFHRYSVEILAPIGNPTCAHYWPTDQPPEARLVYNPSFDLAPGIGDLHVGDTLPWLDLSVSGLAANPTGATVTATLYRLPSGVVTALADETAEVVTGSVVSYQAPPTGATAWRAIFRYRWSALDTTTLGAGQYYARFTVTLSTSTCGPAADEACILTLPPARQAALRINP